MTGNGEGGGGGGATNSIFAYCVLFYKNIAYVLDIL